jgi:hypothetical protein
MLQQQNTIQEANEYPETSEQIPPPESQQRVPRQRKSHYFIRLTPEKQQEAFFAWLPKELHDAPGIDWTKLSPDIMRYCISTIESSPDAPVLAIAAASLHGAPVSRSSQQSVRDLSLLFRELRSKGYIQCLDDLKQQKIWDTWAEQQMQKGMSRGRNFLDAYVSVATHYFPLYLLRLEPLDQQRMQQYALPPSPAYLREKYFPAKRVRSAQQAKRKATTDILVPLYPVLRQLVRFRKQLAERVIHAIHDARQKVEAGEAELPYRFQHTDTIPEVNRDARTISDVQIRGREVTMNWVLWDKRTWVIHHSDRYCEDNVRFAETGYRQYSQERKRFFVQFDGSVSDCLWFGDLIEQRLLRSFCKERMHQEQYRERWEYARQLGFSNGCRCECPGLLDSGDPWFASATERGDELIFEPESLYRGILYGAALTMIALSNGSRMSELLQVSWNKERRVTRRDSVVLLDQEGQPLLGEGSVPLTKQVKLHFQHLLPKGAISEEERQLFPLSREAIRLLGEIKTGLVETHGEIPCVSPSRTNMKYEHLKPERYLFQWNASPDGQLGAIGRNDAQVLLRFILHGLDLHTTQGKPIRVSVHVLRHVMSTHARHYRHVPPEAIAHFYLHHRLQELTGHSPSLPDISEYYTLMTEEQRFAVIRADLDEQEEFDHTLLRLMPSFRDLEQKNADLQAVYEIWHALHPTALGNCGCPGLCPRGTDRALCLGCGYHVEDPEKLGAALAWRTAYEQQAKLLEAQGNAIDAREARIKVQHLDDMINVMRMQLEEESAGRYIPLHKVLPSPHRKQEKHHEEAS